MRSLHRLLVMFVTTNKVVFHCRVKIAVIKVFHCCAFDSLRKDVFCLAFYYKWKNLLIRKHLSFFISMLCFQIITIELILQSNMTMPFLKYIGISENFIRNYIFAFRHSFKLIDLLQLYCENFRNFKIWTSGLLKTCIKIAYPFDFLHNLQPFLLW